MKPIIEALADGQRLTLTLSRTADLYTVTLLCDDANIPKDSRSTIRPLTITGSREDMIAGLDEALQNMPPAFEALTALNDAHSIVKAIQDQERKVREEARLKKSKAATAPAKPKVDPDTGECEDDSCEVQQPEKTADHIADDKDLKKIEEIEEKIRAAAKARNISGALARIMSAKKEHAQNPHIQRVHDLEKEIKTQFGIMF